MSKRLLNFKGKGNTAGFAQNPQNINRSGSNRKSFARINMMLEEKGIPKVTKGQLVEFYQFLFNMTEDELKKIAADKKQPLVLRAIVQELGNPKLRSMAIRDMREYSFGKADETVNHTVKARVLSREEIRDFLNGLEKDY
ncbi:hypothetical protein ACF3N7_05305 [Cruoricaptor ignavus]|uniref:hypothetical protein n=1 Tax=Cruoricaptor ignavus TaxID=1118202 RepID=UPI00370D1E98